MSIIEKMISQLKENRESMSRQMNSINQMSDKSNNLILLMESQRAKECETVENSKLMKPYSFNRGMEQILAKSIEIYEHLSKEDFNETAVDQKMSNIVEFLQRNKQNNQYLSNNVRKTLVISNIIEKVTSEDALKGSIEN